MFILLAQSLTCAHSLRKDDKGDKKIKGTNKNVLKNMTHNEYKNTLFENENKQMRHKMKIQNTK